MSATAIASAAGRLALAPNRLAVLTSVSGLYATKRIRQHRKTGKLIKTPWGCEKFFQVTTVDLTGFAHLCRCLDRLTQRPLAFVIRGETLPETNREKTRRLSQHDPETGDAATFAETPRRWFAVDIDKVPCPTAIDPVSDPEAAIEHLIGLLPPELYDASCWWQFTCAQSLPGAEGTLSARLWFWLIEPLDDASLTRWALAANKAYGGRLVDATIYRAVQAHYVADPIFEDGMRDPLPRRHGVRTGLDEAVTLVVPEPDATDPYTHDGGGYIGVGVDGFLDQIGGENGFRASFVAAIASYFAINGHDADPEPIKARVRSAIVNAPRGGRSNADIERYCSERHLKDVIGWVRAREKVNPRPVPSPQARNEFLKALGRAVPVGTERARAVAAITRHLFRQRFLDPQLAVSLVASWNQVHCSPPLPAEQVRAIADVLATREINAAKRATNAG